MRSTRRTLPLAAAIVLAAGLAAPVFAAPVPAENGAGPVLRTAATKAGVSLSLNGRTFRTTPARIANQRLLTFSGSPVLVAVWEEWNGGVRRSYFAVSPDGASVAEPQSTENLVRLDYATFDPLAGEPTVPPALTAPADNQLFLVQFVATPLDEMRAQVAALGGRVERFLTDNTHVVRMSPAARAGVAALPFVRWVGAYHPAYRLPADLRAEILAGAGAPDAAGVRYSIECMRRGPEQQQPLSDYINQIGGIVDVTIPDQYRLEATLTPAQALLILRRDEVNYLDPSGAPYGADMDIVRQVGGAVPLISGLGYTGQGVRGEVFDGGCLATHQQWAGQAPGVRTTNATDSHGTACYGINFATGTGNAQATGLLPQREMGFISRYQDTNQGGLGSGSITRLSLNTAATNPAGTVRSSFQTSSVGSPRVTTYTTVSAEVDDYLWRVDYLSCQSQSNAANTRDSRPQAWAKNIVSVGAIDLLETVTPTDDIHVNASVGPADDLRVKPDLSHAFWNVFTTYTTSATGYGQFSGTSSATPCTAGHFGLLMQMWHEGVWSGFGGGSTVFADRPKSTTAKALMINGAYRRTPDSANRLYRAYIGWGRADLAALYNIRNKTFIVDETDVVTNGQTRSYQLTVGAGEPEFRATMVFADPQGNPAAAQDRVNDLTLKVTSPNNTVYWGNNGMIATAISGAGQLAGSNSTAPGGAANTVDTVENVFIQSPIAGTWTVEVIASQIVQDARLETPGVTDADFALVVAGVTAAGAPCYPDCNGNGALEVNDFICFQSAFAAGNVPIGDCDGNSALNVNDFICFQNRFAAGCSGL